MQRLLPNPVKLSQLSFRRKSIQETVTAAGTPTFRLLVAATTNDTRPVVIARLKQHRWFDRSSPDASDNLGPIPGSRSQLEFGTVCCRLVRGMNILTITARSARRGAASPSAAFRGGGGDGDTPIQRRRLPIQPKPSPSQEDQYEHQRLIHLVQMQLCVMAPVGVPIEADRLTVTDPKADRSQAQAKQRRPAAIIAPQSCSHR